ncbi:MAG: zinc-ribbon domain-containing protein [Lachnospiraceae bacterium]|nr:zinc-ribbon domain-containing protein [Lachnospiraceae bacterium]
MFCPKCGANLKDGSRFCSKCGSSIGGQGGRPGYPPQMAASSMPPKKKKGNTGLIVFLIILLVLVIAGVGMGILYYMNEKKEAELLESVRAEFQEGNEDDEEDEDRRRKKDEEDDDEDEEREGDRDREEEGLSTTAAATEAEALATEAATTAAQAMTTAAATTAAPMTNEPVTVSLQYSAQTSFSGLIRAGVVKATAVDSSHVVQRGTTIDNSAWSAFDGQATTSWQEGAAGHGIGEYVGISFDREYQVQVVTFRLGNHRSDSWYVKNDVPKVLSINLGGQVFSVTFPREMVEFAVVLSRPVAASSIRVTVDDVYYGTEYEDATIAEIGVYGR